MPNITINGKPLTFDKGQTILQVALANGIEIPHYCYHPGLSIVANCRICLAEVWAPNPKTGQLEAIPKLLPTCQQTCGENQVVYTDSPKAIANQKAVMEYLLINHPVDCPVCDQAGECYLQDYAYQYGRGSSRFSEEKIKQPKKDVGPHVLLYSDRCIMCTRCVRFTREVTGTGELIVEGRGATEQIDVFPGLALDNELSANVVDICPVGALLDKDFLFQQRVWFLEKTPSIDGITSSGDNISIEHNQGVIYRVKPRTNMEVNTWWITDEVRYGWKFIHAENRLTVPAIKSEEEFEPSEAPLAYQEAYEVLNSRLSKTVKQGKKIALMVSPMLTCEDAYLLAVYLMGIDRQIILAVGPVPVHGQDKTFLDGFVMRAEKAPNARGVRRVLTKMAAGKAPLEYDAFLKQLQSDPSIEAVMLTGNYPSDWVTPALLTALDAHKGRFVTLIDTLHSTLCERADIVIPGATWAEKAGTFENANNRLQSFARAIDPIDYCKSESQIALDLITYRSDEEAEPFTFDVEKVRKCMAERSELTEMLRDVQHPPAVEEVEADMQVVPL